MNEQQVCETIFQLARDCINENCDVYGPGCRLRRIEALAREVVLGASGSEDVQE